MRIEFMVIVSVRMRQQPVRWSLCPRAVAVRKVKVSEANKDK